MSEHVEKAELSAFERLLYWFLIPAVFSIVLIVVLLSLFGYDITGNLKRVAAGIPIVNQFVEAPEAAGGSEAAGDALTEEDELTMLRGRLASAEEQLKQYETLAAEKDRTIADLEAQLEALRAERQEEAISEEEYSRKIAEMSQMYAGMSASKAASILENLTLSEQALILSGMNQEDRSDILEKMNPVNAAEVTVMLKDNMSVRDREIAALQERIRQIDSAGAEESFTLTELGRTFTTMDASSAAALLLEMYGVNAAKTINILKATDTAARSQILAAMTELDKKAAAELSARLVP